ncbi:hypothetical protein F4781DRAFT_391303 [Annulohypoxylon bovei var. microspora]|nr:hypothetical protein F4781DRAFT_391303 [Annulohypoxylon bovei var. microspora]
MASPSRLRNTIDILRDLLLFSNCFTCRKNMDTTSWPHLENRALVYNPRVARVTIKKDSTVKKQANKYWELSLLEPTKENLDCWDIFIDSSEDTTWAQKAEEIPKDGYFIARLNLQTLGIKGRLFRKYGKLQTVYILKPEDNNVAGGRL